MTLVNSMLTNFSDSRIKQEIINYRTKLFVLVKRLWQNLRQPCLLKAYVPFLSQDHFQNYCKLYNCQSDMLKH